MIKRQNLQPRILIKLVNIPLTYPPPLLLLFCALLAPTTKHATDVASSALRTRPHRVACTLRVLGHWINDRSCLSTIRTIGVFTTTLGTVDAFLARHVADRLQQTALANLAGDEAVHAVLQGIDLFDAGDFGFVESACAKTLISISIEWREKVLQTYSW